jgi:signal transduction histidine kinase
VACEDGRCTIEVRDDGVGGAEARPETSGLIGLRDRIGALKGAMQVSSPVSVGTSLRAWIPLPVDTVTSEATLAQVKAEPTPRQ